MLKKTRRFKDLALEHVISRIKKEYKNEWRTINADIEVVVRRKENNLRMRENRLKMN